MGRSMPASTSNTTSPAARSDREPEESPRADDRRGGRARDRPAERRRARRGARACIAAFSRRIRGIPTRSTSPACSPISRDGTTRRSRSSSAASRLVPDRADCYSNLGIILQSTGRFDRAIDAYRRAIAIEPDHANAHNNLGVVLQSHGRPRRRRSGIPRGDRDRSRPHRRVHQSRHPAERVEAHGGSGSVLLAR